MAPTTAATATTTTAAANKAPTPKLAKFKSSSLDNEIYTANRRSTIATAASDWKALRAPLNGRSPHVGSTAAGQPGGVVGHMTRAASTSSLASSTRTMTNYQEYKMEIINQVSPQTLAR